MEIRYLENALAPEALAGLREMAGWGCITLSQARKALRNTLYSVSAVDGGETVGMGRLVGDGAMIWYVQDLIVAPSYRRKGVATEIMTRLYNHIAATAEPGTAVTVGLMAAAGKEPFYEKFGFRIRPNDSEGAGMTLRKRL